MKYRAQDMVDGHDMGSFVEPNKAAAVAHAKAEYATVTDYVGVYWVKPSGEKYLGLVNA